MAYMPISPVISVSQALGTSASLSMLITEQGVMPKFSSMDVQHWTAVPDNSCSSIKRSRTTPNLAIFSRESRGIPSTETYSLNDSSFVFTEVSAESRDSICPKMSDRSTVSTEMPASSSSFSEYLTVMNAAGLAPTWPKRAPFRPPTIRQILPNFLRSSRNSSDSGLVVCFRVSVKGIPYWVRLLQTLIFPQKLSRLRGRSIAPTSSGNAWTRTGTSRSASRIVSATPLSSPKFGRVIRMPSMVSRCFLNRSAHFLASLYVSTVP